MQDLTPDKRLEKAFREYHKAEKHGSLLLTGWALASCFAGLFLLVKLQGDLWTGMAIPILAIAAIHFLVGFSVLIRTGKQMKFFVSKLQNPHAIYAEEMPRMERVVENFEKHKKVELLLFFLGFSFLMAAIFAGTGDFMLGNGAGLCLQSGFTLVFDLFASFRASLYVHELKMFHRD